MKIEVQNYKMLCLLIGVTCAFETVFRIATVTPIFGAGLFIALLFGAVSGSIQYVILSLFREKTRRIALIFMIVISAIVYASQLVYFEIFHTYYTIYSMVHGAQVAQFWREAFVGIARQIVPVAAVFTIAGLAIILAGRFQRTKERQNRKAAGAFAFAACLTAVLVIALSGRGFGSPYYTVFKINSIDASMDSLGLTAGMLLDCNRLLFGFEPVFEMGEEPNEPVEIIPAYAYNKMNIDFKALSEGETDETLIGMNRYFEHAIPTKQNEKTGLFSGNNLIMIVGESFSSYAVSEKYTPTLYKMQHEGFFFTNFYNPIWGVSTSDGEYVACTGLIPKAGVWSMRESSENSLPFTMGNQFRKLGIQTRAYHNHYAEYYGRTESHPNLGYLYKGLGTGLKVKEQWPESDLEMIELSAPEYLTPEEDGKIAPFHVYYMTVSGHLNYTFTGNAMSKKNKTAVADLAMSDACRAYMACNIELDKAMKKLLDELEEAGELENTVIVLSGDHYPYGLKNEEISEFLGHNVDPVFELYKSSLIIYRPGMKPETVDKYCSSLDIIPTLSNLFGLEYDSRLLMGRDIFSDAAPLVIFKNRSWITDKGKYDADSGTFFPHESSTEVSESYLKGIHNRVENKFTYSRLILEKDYYRYLGL